MFSILHIDSSARQGTSEQHAHGSHTRRLGQRLLRNWSSRRPQDRIVYRDVGSNAPQPVDARWVHAAFTPPDTREPWMDVALASSDMLVDEVIAADMLVIGAPMYNFGMPAQLKAWVDNIVRVGRTFGFDRNRGEVPYWPMLGGQGRRAIILASRGDHGYGQGERQQADNHVERGLISALRYIGIERFDCIAVEYDEFGGERLQASLLEAEHAVDRLAEQLVDAVHASQAERAHAVA